MQVLCWQVSSELKKETEENYRTNFAIGLKDREPMEIIRELTFDGMAPKIEIADIEHFFDFVEKNFLPRKLAGVGLEVGGGPATFSSILAKRSAVQKMYDVEVCRPIVELLAPRITDFILDNQSDKVVAVIGDFDHMELADSSVDFIFDFFSLHHSNDLSVTLKECHRILKPGAFAFCFDKARPDHYTRQDLDELLDVEYGDDYKKQFGLPLDQKLTRRMNGEKEYRLKDWRASFFGAGFSGFRHYYLAKIFGQNSLARFVKNLLAGLPVELQLLLNRFLPKPKFSHKFIISQENRIFSNFVNKFPKEISLMIAHK